MTHDKVVDIFSRQPHLAGQCRCLHCNYEWVGVCPVGSLNLECPECHLLKGVTVGICIPDGKCFTCFCDNALFFLTEDRNLICANCGEIAVYD